MNSSRPGVRTRKLISSENNKAAKRIIYRAKKTCPVDLTFSASVIQRAPTIAFMIQIPKMTTPRPNITVGLPGEESEEEEAGLLSGYGDNNASFVVAELPVMIEREDMRDMRIV
jgi:hypothetical protein